MMSEAMIDAYGLDIKQEIIHKAGGGQIEAVSSSARAAEGIRGTWTALNESHHWLENNEGHAMARVLTRNAVKTKARFAQFTNSHNPGENSVAEQAWLLYEDVQAGKAHDVGVLYDSREAAPDTRMVDPDTGEADIESIRRGVLAARGDSHWVNVDGMVGEILDVRTSEAEARRFYLNQICPEATSWIAPFEWDSCKADHLELLPGEEITLGFDGSLSDDNTALTACRVSDGALFTLKVWAAPKHAKKWTVPTEEVDAYVQDAFERYRVLAANFDRALWESYLDKWTVLFGRKLRVKATAKAPLEFDMRSRKRDFAAACETFLAAVLNKELSHTGDPVLRQHVLNAQRRPYQGFVGIAKEHRESPRKIDAAVTAVLAYAARQEVVKSRKHGGKRKVVLY
jgi:phage terminase large subunit-like protein